MFGITRYPYRARNDPCSKNQSAAAFPLTQLSRHRGHESPLRSNWHLSAILCRYREPSVRYGVTATYRSEIRDLNELNFARFDAKLEQRIAEVRADIAVLHGKVESQIDALNRKVDAQVGALNSKFDTQVFALSGKIDVQIDVLSGKIDAQVDVLSGKIDAQADVLSGKIDQQADSLRGYMDSRIPSLRAELIKWMFLFWLGTVATMLGFVSLLQ